MIAVMDDLERDLLRFAAAHRLICGDQVAVLAGGEEHDDIALTARGLVRRGLLSRVRLAPTRPDCLMITETGLAAIDSPLPVPVWEMRGLREALAAGWVWVRAQDGRFTGLTGVVSHREMILHDSQLTGDSSAAGGAARPYGIRLAGRRPADGSGLHHPAVLLEFFDGWAAVEFALGGATPRGLAALLTAYGLDDRYGRIVFMVDQERVATEIEAAAVSAGVASVVTVQWAVFA
jgi:hypothetical protein